MELNEKELATIIDQTVEKRLAEVKASQQADREVAEKKYSELHGAYLNLGKQSGKKEIPEDIKLGRAIRVKACATANGTDPVYELTKGAHKDFEGAEELKGVFESKAANMTVPSEGGFLVPQAYSPKQIELLYAETAAMKCPITRLPMPNGNLTLRRMDAGASIAYFGETPQKPAYTQDVFGDIRLMGKKIGATTAISNDLLRSNDINADAWIIRDLQRKFQLKLDYTMLYGAATQYTPAGINNLMATANQSGGTTTATTSDIPMSMIATLDSGNAPQDGRVWIMHPQMKWYLANLKATTGQFIFRDELAQNRLIGYPVLTTTQSGYTNTGTYNTSSADIWLGSWSEFLFGEQLGYEVVTSKEASYYDGTGTLVSAFGRDETVVRVIGVHDFNIQHDVSFVKFTGKFATS